ncbi:MAG TPA: DUF4097 domain-containing protein [Clostridiaceae bacterium]|nr:DUF4097 domain-containing protein [Clostridiaceae bacterium]
MVIWQGVNIETTSGDSKIKLPEGSEFHLSFTSTSGEVSSDFPISVKGTVKKNSLEGTVVSSKNSIKVKTVSGDLELLK